MKQLCEQTRCRLTAPACEVWGPVLPVTQGGPTASGIAVETPAVSPAQP